MQNAEPLLTESAEIAEPDIIDVEPERPPETALAKIESDLATMQAHAAATLQRSQLMVDFQMNMRKMIATNVRQSHWVRFGDKIRPDGSECLRLRMLFGVDIGIDDMRRDDYEDDGGKYYVYHTSGKASLGPITVPCFGSASSRTKFFAKAHGEYVDPRDINPSFISKMAWMDCFKNGIRILFGLDLDPEEIQNISGRDVADRSKDFTPKDNTKDDDQDTSEQRAMVRTFILELSGGNKADASFFLEALTTFTTKDGKAVKGKKTVDALTAKQVANLYNRRDKDLSQARYHQIMSARNI